MVLQALRVAASSVWIPVNRREGIDRVGACDLPRGHPDDNHTALGVVCKLGDGLSESDLPPGCRHLEVLALDLKPLRLGLTEECGMTCPKQVGHDGSAQSLTGGGVQPFGHLETIVNQRSDCAAADVEPDAEPYMPVMSGVVVGLGDVLEPHPLPLEQGPDPLVVQTHRLLVLGHVVVDLDLHDQVPSVGGERNRRGG